LEVEVSFSSLESFTDSEDDEEEDETYYQEEEKKP